MVCVLAEDWLGFVHTVSIKTKERCGEGEVVPKFVQAGSTRCTHFVLRLFVVLSMKFLPNFLNVLTDYKVVTEQFFDFIYRVDSSSVVFSA